jgi:hypothetical protein
MKYATTFWLVAGISFGMTHGVWGVIGMFALLVPVALVMSWYRGWRKEKMEDEGYPDGY